MDFFFIYRQTLREESSSKSKSWKKRADIQGRSHHEGSNDENQRPQDRNPVLQRSTAAVRRRGSSLTIGDAVDPVLLKKRADSAERSRRYRARQKDGRSNSPLSTVNACEPAGLSPLSDVTNLEQVPLMGGLSAVTADATAVGSSDEQVTSSTYRKVHCTPLSYVPVDVTASGISAEQRISDVKNDSDAREEMRKAKNRIHQQEYRKRKKEEREKAEEGYNIQTPTLPTVENEQDQPPKKRKYVRKNKTMPGNKQDNVSTPNLQGLDPTPCSAVTEQQQTPASVNRFSVDVTPVSALTGEHGQTGSKLNQKGGHVVVDGWLHRNDDYLPSYSAVMRNNDGKGDQGVTPDQTQGGVAHDDDVGHHGNWEPDENDNIHFGEEDLDAADPGVQYDLPIEDQDEEARLYGLRDVKYKSYRVDTGRSNKGRDPYDHVYANLPKKTPCSDAC
ncbi:hypothetical protein EJB05_40006, partial [Eragrostis curvula]